MAKRRYVNFIIERDGEESYECNDWRSVFTSFQKAESATIYGLPAYDGANYEVIMSK